MKNKKIISLVVIATFLLGFTAIVNSKQKEESKVESNIYSESNYKDKVNPLSKEYAIKILEAEYGDYISVSKEDIKKVGEEYIVDVVLKDESEDVGEHDHSIGVHKINIYTGELMLPN
ncbi:hypothetical protein [Romboutsia lituseburensis]|uniref:Uncharacterized protein n=1 Tax=Romboutsia lituseburensis DSM 797 TaxID=1121325 RepID=A0A1G9QHR8_9FIRM|nr:hypothetical protein [Romboutsia lituseburensis]CEH35526.1 Hypothetical protein RLITU_2951 [Romboutsia lituseburensis]SDM10592.1 hypothetical protein SAMN04515677_105218 [Romboutsia lituseburensis DSM 797]